MRTVTCLRCPRGREQALPLPDLLPWPPNLFQCLRSGSAGKPLRPRLGQLPPHCSGNPGWPERRGVGGWGGGRGRGGWCHSLSAPQVSWPWSHPGSWPTSLICAPVREMVLDRYEGWVILIFLLFFSSKAPDCYINLPGEVFTTDPSPTMRSFSIHYQEGNRPWWGGKYLLHLIRLTHNLTTITAAPFFALFQLRCEKLL